MQDALHHHTSLPLLLLLQVSHSEPQNRDGMISSREPRVHTSTEANPRKLSKSLAYSRFPGNLNFHFILDGPRPVRIGFPRW